MSAGFSPCRPDRSDCGTLLRKANLQKHIRPTKRRSQSRQQIFPVDGLPRMSLFFHWQDSRRSRRLRPGNLPTYRAGRNRDLRIVANALRLTHIAACHHVQLFTIFSEPNRSCHLRPALAKRRERDVFSAANCKRNCPGHATIVATKSLGLGYGSNGHFHAGDSNR
jgi:hypothetical protein